MSWLTNGVNGPAPSYSGGTTPYNDALLNKIAGDLRAWGGPVDAQQQNLSSLGVLTFAAGGYISGRARVIAAAEPYALGIQYNGATDGIWLGGTLDAALVLSSWGGAELVRLTQSGKLGVGAIPATKIDAAGTIRTSAWTTPTGGVGIEIGYDPTGAAGFLNRGNIQVYDRSGGVSGDLILQGAGGNVIIGGGGAAPSYQLQLSTDSAAKPTSSTWTVASDARLKRRVQTMADDSLAMIVKLRFVRGEYNGLAGVPEGQPLLGLVAQEARSHMPEAVRTFRARLHESDTEDTELLGLDYHALILHSARALQQVAERLAAVEAAANRF